MAKKKVRDISSEQQRKLFGAAAGGQRTKAPGLSKTEAKQALKKAEGKDLPKKSRRR